jgi:Flp pilus assembly protein TadD
MTPFRRAMVAVLAALAALFVSTTAVARWYHQERAARARAHIEAGAARAADGQLLRSAEEFRAALLLERGDPAAERALALTLYDLGRLAESESYLLVLLERDPVSGPLNLALARIRAASADPDARRLYQRAIYGEWPEGAGTPRLQARFELAGYLRTQATREELLAELLRLKADVPPADVAGTRRLAALFLTAGDAGQAVDVLRLARQESPRDVALLGELAAAELQAGQPADARRTLRQALAAAPERDDLRERLQIVDRVLTLDPTLPNLRLTTRARRARALLAAVVERTAACAAAGGATAAMRARAGTRVTRRAPLTADAAEEDLALAVELWTGADRCRSGGPEGAAVAEVVERLRTVSEDPQP